MQPATSRVAFAFHIIAQFSSTMLLNLLAITPSLINAFMHFLHFIYF